MWAAFCEQRAMDEHDKKQKFFRRWIPKPVSQIRSHYSFGLWFSELVDVQSVTDVFCSFSSLQYGMLWFICSFNY